MDWKKLAEIFKGNDSLIIIKKVEIKEVPKLFGGRVTVGAKEFHQTVGGHLQLTKEETKQVMQKLQAQNLAEVNHGKGRISFTYERPKTPPL